MENKYICALFLLLFSMSSSRRPRCGGLTHATLTRPCEDDDSYCGKWNDRFWSPTFCEYEDISPSKAIQCLSNRTLAFVGDSQIRDIGIGVAYFLLGIYTLESAPMDKFDRKMRIHGTAIEPFEFWSNNPQGIGKGSFFYPSEWHVKQHNTNWSVQIWSMPSRQYVHNRLEDLLSNRPSQARSNLRPIDLAFISFGLHERSSWHQPEISNNTGENYYNVEVAEWLQRRANASVPSVWVSMNPHCTSIPSPFSDLAVQADAAEMANKYINTRLLHEGHPYWDVGAYLRTPLRCNISADGLHVRMFANVMAAKMLFNHLCDESGEWRGSEDAFL